MVILITQKNKNERCTEQGNSYRMNPLTVPQSLTIPSYRQSLLGEIHLRR